MSRRSRAASAWQPLVVVAVSAGYESLFVHHGIAWLFDEGWPLYAAMRLHAGGVLYGDVSFVFPPGHLLPAWIAYALDPPGIVLARIFYAAFDVGLCVAMYFLARRLTTPAFALLGALLLAIAAPRSHLSQLLFGYRYLLLSVPVLLAFARRLSVGAEGRTGARRAFGWMLLAGMGTGVTLAFRLTPAFAVSCAIAAGALVAARDWRECARDYAGFVLGLGLVQLPILAWFAAGVGLEAVWREAVVRAVVMTELQSLPAYDLSLLPASGDRRDVFRWFIALQYRLYGAMYAGYVVALVAGWLRARLAGRRFEGALLLAVAVWGGAFLLRALGRSDDHHLMSALPPACLLLAHALGVAARLAGERFGGSPGVRRLAVAGLCSVVLAAWAYLQRVDLFLGRELRGQVPLAATDGRIEISSRRTARRVDRVVEIVGSWTGPGEVILDMTGAPLFYVLTDRLGPGFADVITPGIFMSEAEEEHFVGLLEGAPPAVVIWPRRDFDEMRERSIDQIAPRTAAWVRERYEQRAIVDRYALLTPRPQAASADRSGATPAPARILP